jgi:hypothetical protein
MFLVVFKTSAGFARRRSVATRVLTQISAVLDAQLTRIGEDRHRQGVLWYAAECVEAIESAAEMVRSQYAA